MADERVSALLCEMAEPANRVDAASKLARILGAETLIVFVLDEEIGQLLPARGFPQSVPGGEGWRALTEKIRQPGVHAGSVAFPDAEHLQPACALVLKDASAFVLIGGAPRPEDLDQASTHIIAALLRAESRATAAEARASSAKEMARHAGALMAAVDAARAAAEQATGAKNEFLAMLGHELRNPLSPIVTALQLLKLRGDFENRNELGVIERQVDHLVTLVDDLMDVARITRGKVELKLEDVELSQVVIAAVEMASPLLERRSHSFTLDVPRTGLRLRADLQRLKQIIANLLTNAAKYTEPGGVITLRARREAGEIALSVTDNGIGMSPELVPRVFELFVQSQRSSDRREGGLGIGLALVRNLVQMHGGSVSAESAGTGLGSKFTVRLPLATTVDAPVTAGSQAATPLTLEAVVRRRILVVDDNIDAAQTLAFVLREVGHEVAVAHDGPTALEAAESFEPDVAILDIGLPVMDGYELARKLRMFAKAPRLVALTGYGQPQDKSRSAAAGFDYHLLKPVDTERILAAIGEIRSGGAGDGRSSADH